MWKLAVPVLSIVLVSGCAATVPPLTTQFSPSDFSRYDAPGTGSVRGQAFTKTRAGDVKYAAGNVVVLCPATTYTEDWLETQFRKGGTADSIDARAKAYFRRTVADGEGRFRFDGLPPGKYIVACRFSWEVARRGVVDVNVGYECELADGQTLDVVLRDLSYRNSRYEAWTQVPKY